MSLIPKKVKIVATLGPASDHPDTVYRMADAGVNVFRINLSHATHEEITNRIAAVRHAEEKIGKPIAVLGDLAGPKIRIGDMEDNVFIERGDELHVLKETVKGDNKRFSLNFPSIIPQLKKDAEIFIDDGKIKMVVIKESETSVVVKVLVGGHLKPKKGFNAQGISLASQGLSEKDKRDLAFVLEQGADAIAISFVQSARDVEIVRELLPENSKHHLIAKIETTKSIEEIEKIVQVADGIMVARGDLGLAMPMEEIPFLQKQLIEMCLQKAKPVITATQMLESMTTNPIPTRAEVTDVANAILDGTDAVMLSGESAAGTFPVETVEMMARIIRRTTPLVSHRTFPHEKNIAHGVSSSAAIIAEELQGKVIISFTESGATARRISRHRPTQTIIALTPNKTTWRNLNFSAGVYSFLIEPTRDFDHMMQQARQFAKENPVIPLKKGDPLVIVAGLPFGRSGSTNMIYVERV